MTAPLHMLDEAARLLREELAPTLAGAGRYHSLLAAKAIDTARREFALAAPLAAREAALPGSVESLRGGDHDDDGALYAALLDVAILRAHIAEPKALNAAERARLEELSR